MPREIDTQSVPDILKLEGKQNCFGIDMSGICCNWNTRYIQCVLYVPRQLPAMGCAILYLYEYCAMLEIYFRRQKSLNARVTRVCVYVNMHVCVCSCKIVIMYVRFFPILLCNMFVIVCMPMPLGWVFVGCTVLYCTVFLASGGTWCCVHTLFCAAVVIAIYKFLFIHSLLASSCQRYVMNRSARYRDVELCVQESPCCRVCVRMGFTWKIPQRISGIR